MHNYFSVPKSLPQWLVSSACWAASCLAAFKIASYVLTWIWPSDNSMYPILGLAMCICVMMWRRVIRVGCKLLQTSPSDSVLLNTAAGVAISAFARFCCLRVGHWLRHADVVGFIERATGQQLAIALEEFLDRWPHSQNTMSPKKTLTAGQWLSQSIGWTVCCLGGWVVLTSILLCLQVADNRHVMPIEALMLSSAVVAHLLICRQGFAGIWSWSPAPSGWLSEVAVRVWVAVLTLFQLVSLLLIIGAVGLALGNGDEGRGGTF